MASGREQIDIYPLRCMPHGAYAHLMHSGKHGRIGHKRTCQGIASQLPRSQTDIDDNLMFEAGPRMRARIWSPNDALQVTLPQRRQWVCVRA